MPRVLRSEQKPITGHEVEAEFSKIIASVVLVH